MSKKTIGRVDCINFPKLQLHQIDCKIDTGAYTSSIHCSEITKEGDKLRCRFYSKGHPNFNGKEVIIFGLTDPKFETILVIKGPSINTKVQKKERLFGLWINTQRIIYKNLPSIFFIASSLLSN